MAILFDYMCTDTSSFTSYMIRICICQPEMKKNFKYLVGVLHHYITVRVMLKEGDSDVYGDDMIKSTLIALEMFCKL